MGVTLASSAFGGVTITSFPPSIFNPDTGVMDSTLGIDGFTLEDFEDATLIPGLAIEFLKGGVAGFNETLSQLSNVLASPTVWDGSHVLLNHPTNGFLGLGSASFSTRITFQFSTPALSVGVGLVGFQSLVSNAPLTDHRLIINGLPLPDTLETLAAPNFVGHSRFRNAYLRIDASEGMNITSIGFENISFAELLEFDHLAVQYVCEPATLPLLLLGCIGAAILARRRATD